MSDALYSTRLRYVAGVGVAKLRGVCVDISAPPVICGVRVHAIDYIPEIGLAQIQPYAEGWRDMETPERRAADAALIELTKGPPP